MSKSFKNHDANGAEEKHHFLQVSDTYASKGAANCSSLHAMAPHMTWHQYSSLGCSSLLRASRSCDHRYPLKAPDASCTYSADIHAIATILRLEISHDSCEWRISGAEVSIFIQSASHRHAEEALPGPLSFRLTAVIC